MSKEEESRDQRYQHLSTQGPSRAHKLLEETSTPFPTHPYPTLPYPTLPFPLPSSLFPLRPCAFAPLRSLLFLPAFPVCENQTRIASKNEFCKRLA
jgi:hypothetical protein